MDNSKYLGEELTIFAEAKNWKKYYGKLIQPYLGPRVMEVGAGIGSTTAVLAQKEHREWVCLEPDTVLLSVVQERIDKNQIPSFCVIRQGTTSDIPTGELFDSILYIDVLEHIKEDQEEVARAGRLISPGGHLIILSPAYNYLFSPFDKSIGHFRRYDKNMVRSLTPTGLKLVKNQYLDSVGLFTSLANKWFLKQSYPTLQQILFWDQKLIPFAKLMDKLVFYSFGRSILSIWEKEVR